jgi:hypothetical protein
LIISMLGISVSISSGYITILYGGYSNRNWQKADDIAENRGWKDLLPVQAPQLPQAAATTTHAKRRFTLASVHASIQCDCVAMGSALRAEEKFGSRVRDFSSRGGVLMSWSRDNSGVVTRTAPGINNALLRA